MTGTAIVTQEVTDAFVALMQARFRFSATVRSWGPNIALGETTNESTIVAEMNAALEDLQSPFRLKHVAYLDTGEALVRIDTV